MHQGRLCIGIAEGRRIDVSGHRDGSGVGKEGGIVETLRRTPTIDVVAEDFGAREGPSRLGSAAGRLLVSRGRASMITGETYESLSFCTARMAV